jgi:hypothetical protein
MQVGKLIYKLSDYHLVKRTLFRAVSYPCEKKGFKIYCVLGIIAVWAYTNRSANVEVECKHSNSLCGLRKNEEWLATSNILCQFGTD